MKRRISHLQNLKAEGRVRRTPTLPSPLSCVGLSFNSPSETRDTEVRVQKKRASTESGRERVFSILGDKSHIGLDMFVRVCGCVCVLGDPSVWLWVSVLSFVMVGTGAGGVSHSLRLIK